MRYSATTTASPPEVIRLARDAFGADGAGMRLAELDLLQARFEAPVGHVAVEARRVEGLTEVLLETREFDREVRAFINKLPRQSMWRSLLARIRGNGNR
jgi:hypothetical protein